MANSQHRCVFVGNIPYDATEEQLVQICEEVGPVVSFRLLKVKEIGKPKGFGFCEYKDEETALSARRNLQGYEINGRQLRVDFAENKDEETALSARCNLQGYEINGRQLRVDFAENDKNSDRNREQGHGGPELATNVDPEKQFGVPAVRGDSSLLQPLGVYVAMTAATVMAGALGSAQTRTNPNQNGLQSQPLVGTDPLTLHLAKLPKSQLNEILTDLKAHIMLGMITPELLQMPNIQQVPVPHSQPPPQDGQQVQQPAVQTLSRLPPLAQIKMPIGFVPQSQSQTYAVPLINSQYDAVPLPTQPQFQTLQLAQHQVLQQSTLPGMLAVPTLPFLHPQKPAHLYNRPETQMAVSSSTMQMKQSLLQHPGQIASASMGNNTQLVAPVQHSRLTRPPLPHSGFQLPPVVESVLLQQVLNLTPEQLSSLPPDQQQQVIQLQQMLRQPT